MAATTLEVLKKELELVSSLRIAGIHSRVSDAVGISKEYSQKIRNANFLKTDNPENRELLQNMINEYRKEITDFNKKASEIITEKNSSKNINRSNDQNT